ncbi:MAG: DNA repair protein RecN [Lachnospiraceae bacterium]|nr:DNA repair protein RecN [Lachnospiraceae bacterium]
MLESLRVKNLALIDETEVCFSKGLNILTGETGAGKSLVIGSVKLALGGKADRSFIRNGADHALVELVFSVTKEQEKALKELEVYPEDGMLSIQRRIMPAKSVCRINGEMIGSQTLREAAGILLDIHGQHDNQSLLKKQKHLGILDAYCAKELGEEPKSVKEQYLTLKALEEELVEAESLEKDSGKEIALAEFECKEIEEAGIKPGEDEMLEAKFRKMNHARKIGEAVKNAASCIGGLDMENASTMTDRALRELHSVTEYDAAFADMTEELQAAREILNDVNHDLIRYMDGIEFSETDYMETESRLNLINRLKDKYGQTLEEIQKYQEERTAFLEKVQDISAYRDKLKNDIERQRQVFLTHAKKVSDIRKKRAAVLEKEISRALVELNFLQVEFRIRIETDENRAGITGMDDVEFVISLNPGEKPRSLGDVASGGELSRIMLALKTVFAKQDQIQTLIFDEIDAGISGKTAWKVSEKLAVLGRDHQVICITHLPQIAAMADSHFLIQKSANENQTTTELITLERDEMIRELARMLGGEELTEAVINNAAELKKMADETKQY